MIISSMGSSTTMPPAKVEQLIDISDIGAVLLERKIIEGNFENEFLWGRNMHSPVLTHRKKQFKNIELTLLFTNQDEKTFLINKSKLISRLVHVKDFKSYTYNQGAFVLEFKDVPDLQYLCYYEGPEEVDKVNNSSFMVKLKLLCVRAQGKRIEYDSRNTSNPGSLQDIENPGNYDAPCIIIVNNLRANSGTTCTINGLSHSIESKNGSLIINSYTNKVIASAGYLGPSSLTFWAYPLLPPGKNNITIHNGSCSSINVDFNPVY